MFFYDYESQNLDEDNRYTCNLAEKNRIQNQSFSKLWRNLKAKVLLKIQLFFFQKVQKIINLFQDGTGNFPEQKVKNLFISFYFSFSN